MNIAHIFDREGVTIGRVARVAGVHETTAGRWKDGKPLRDIAHVAKLHAHGILTDGDLRAAGIAIPLTTSGEAA